MGDVGSAFLGFAFGVLPLIMLKTLPPGINYVVRPRLPLFAILVLWPFIADGAFTFFRRLLRGESVWLPHRSHLYQRLVQTGWSHAQIASYYGLWALLCSVAGFCYLNGWMSMIAFVIPVLFAGLTWSLTVFFENKKNRRQI